MRADLNENHLRRLATATAMVDAATARLLDLLDQKSTPTNMTVIERSSLSSAEREAVRGLLSQLQPLTAQFAEKYGLAKHQKDLRRMITAEAAQLWTVLEDTHARTMRGRGHIPDTIATQIDVDIDQMLSLVNQLMRLVQVDVPVEHEDR